MPGLRGNFGSVGKSICRGLLRPGEHEHIEAVVRPGTITVVLCAAAFGARTEARMQQEIPAPARHGKQPTFRFLEPRRLSSDQITISEGEGENARPVLKRRGAFRLCGKGTYQIVIRPRLPGVQNIELRDVAQKVAVRQKVPDAASYSWTFRVEVLADELLSQPERLFYDVESDAGPLRGEIHLRVQPSKRRHLLFATTLGVVLTTQGVVNASRLAWKAYETSTWSSLLTWDFVRNVMLTLSILLVWGVMRVADGVIARFGAEE